MVLLTGASGFIGSCLLGVLNSRGIEDIIVTDRLGNDIRYLNLSGKKFERYLDKDLLFPWLEETGGKNIDLIIHIGANADTMERNLDVILQDNYYYPQRLYKWAAENNKRFIYASSSATYGDGQQGFCEDSIEKLRPLGPYAFSKHLFDIWMTRQKLKPKQVVGLKFFNVYGPNEYHKAGNASVIHSMYSQIMSKGAVDIFDDNRVKKGEQCRDFIYVFDLIKIILHFMFNAENTCGIYNAGSGVATSFNKLAQIIFDVLKITPKITNTPLPSAIKESYQNFTCADVTKLRKAGFNEKFISINDGIADYIKNYLVTGSRY